MKRSLSFILTLVMVICVITSVPVTVSAASESDFLFILNSDGESYSVHFAYSTISGDIVIPATYEGLPVTAIADWGFSDRENITSVTIPDSVTSIGEYAFLRCTSLKSVAMGNGITSIGEYAFEKCTRLVSVEFSDNLTNTGNYVFLDCISLKSVELPDNLTTIGDGAFNGCTNLASVIIPDGVTSIGDNAFYTCPKLLSVTIPDSVTYIGCEAFGYYYFNDSDDFGNLDDFTVYGKRGTEAEVYALQNGFLFIDVGGECVHLSTEWITDKKATVYKAGEKHKECTECGEILKTATIKQLKCSKPTLKSIQNTQYGVLTKWGTVKGADKYYIYRKTSKGSYSRIGSTTNTYYTDKTAKSGTKYYYIVKAINEAGGSVSSSALSRYYLADPTLNTPSTTTKGVGLRWSKVTGASGYMVYRRTTNGSYKIISTEKGVSNLTYRDTTAEKGTKYYYKVKAYKSKTYSAYSNTKAITDKY